MLAHDLPAPLDPLANPTAAPDKQTARLFADIAAAPEPIGLVKKAEIVAALGDCLRHAHELLTVGDALRDVEYALAHVDYFGAWLAKTEPEAFAYPVLHNRYLVTLCWLWRNERDRA